MKRLIIALCAAAVLVLMGTGCRTAEGAGEDIESAGEAIQDTVD